MVPYASADEAAAALADDPAIDALLADNVTLRQTQGQGAAINAAGPALESNAYVIASARQSTTLHENIEQALATLRADGVLVELEDRWFGAAASSP